MPVLIREGAAKTVSADHLGSACERLESLAKGKCTEGKAHHTRHTSAQRGVGVEIEFNSRRVACFFSLIFALVAFYSTQMWLRTSLHPELATQLTRR